MGGPRNRHTEWSKPDKDNYHMIWLTCGIWKIDTNEFIRKREIDPESYETNLWLPKGKGPERGIDDLSFICFIGNNFIIIAHAIIYYNPRAHM